MKPIYLIYVWFLFWGVIGAWYNPVISWHGCLVAFTGLHCFFVRICSIPLFGLFVFWGCFPSPRSMLIYLASSGTFHHWRGLVTLWPIRSASSSVISWCVLSVLLSLVQCYSTGEINGLMNCLVIDFLFRTKCVYHHLLLTATQGTDCPDQGARRTWHYLPRHIRMDFFWSLDQRLR